jgi:hypothetical protein
MRFRVCFLRDQTRFLEPTFGQTSVAEADAPRKMSRGFLFAATIAATWLETKSFKYENACFARF